MRHVKKAEDASASTSDSSSSTSSSPSASGRSSPTPTQTQTPRKTPAKRAVAKKQPRDYSRIPEKKPRFRINDDAPKEQVKELTLPVIDAASPQTSQQVSPPAIGSPVLAGSADLLALFGSPASQKSDSSGCGEVPKIQLTSFSAIQDSDSSAAQSGPSGPSATSDQSAQSAVLASATSDDPADEDFIDDPSIEVDDASDDSKTHKESGTKGKKGKKATSRGYDVRLS